MARNLNTCPVVILMKSIKEQINGQEIGISPCNCYAAIRNDARGFTCAGARATIHARALNGVLYIRLQPVAADTLHALLADLPGTQWVATTLAGIPRWGAPPAGLDLMRRIKAEFDPAGMLNQGRYVAGI